MNLFRMARRSVSRGIRACLKIALCELCVIACERFGSDEGGVVGCAG